jgi:5-methylcytosine-specific restriction protein A
MGTGVRQAEYREQAKVWYKSKQWQRLRKQQLDKYPYCQCPIHKGANKAFIATVADHIEPHRGDKHKFFNGRLQSLTATCHSSIKQQIERSGTFTGADAQGNPLDARSSWYDP